MKALYALIIACLALQACIRPSETPAVSADISEHSTLSEYLAARPMDDQAYMAAITPGIQPIDGAEFAGTSRDDTYAEWDSMNDDEYTAAVTAAIRSMEGYSFDAGADFNFGDDHTAAVTMFEHYRIDADVRIDDSDWGP